MKTLVKIYSEQSSWLFKIAFSLMLLLPLCFQLGIAVLDLSMSGIALLFLIHSIMTKDFRWCKNTWVWVFVALWGYLLLRSFFTINPANSFRHALVFVRFAVFALAVEYWVMEKPEYRRVMLIALLVALLFVTLNLYMEYFFKYDMLGHHALGVRLVGLGNKLRSGSINMMMMFPAIAYLLMHGGNKSLPIYQRVLFALCATFILLGVFLAGERDAALMTILGCGLLFVFMKKARLSLLIFAVIFLFSFMLIFRYDYDLFVRETQSVERVVKTFVQPVQDFSFLGRGAATYKWMFKTAWDVFKQQPVFGVGLGEFYPACQQYVATKQLNTIKKRQTVYCTTSAQNIYLEWLADTGLVGSFLFFLIVFLWFERILRNYKIVLLDPVIVGAVIALIVRLFPLQSTTSFFFSWGGVSFWWMSGWVFAYLKQRVEVTHESS